MPDIFLKIPLWTRLRFVSNSTAAKTTILVPVIGYLIIFNEKVVEFLSLARPFGAHSGTDVSLRLILIYLGLCAVSAAVIIYGWFCPTEVKHYGSAAAYVQGDGPSLRGFVIDNISKTLAADERYFPQMKELSDDFGLIAHRRPVTDDDNERYRTEHLHIHFDYLNRIHPVARLGTVVCYVVGFGLLAIPSAHVFSAVIGIVFKRIFG